MLVLYQGVNKMPSGIYKHKPLTEEHKRNLSQSHLGKKRSSNFVEKARKRMIGNKINLGRKASKETKEKLSQIKKGKYCGDKHYNWKGGITPLRKKLYFSLEYKLWRTAVFERDKYTCIWCGKIGGILQADHIKPWRDYPELRFAIDNGRTLCVECHKKTDTYGAQGVMK